MIYVPNQGLENDMFTLSKQYHGCVVDLKREIRCVY